MQQDVAVRRRMSSRVMDLKTRATPRWRGGGPRRHARVPVREANDDTSPIRAVFTSKIFLSKLHYSSITLNFLIHAWNIKFR